MSHGYPYSRSLSDIDLRRNPQTYSSSSESNLYGERQPSFSFVSSSPGLHDSISTSVTSEFLQPTQNSQDHMSNVLRRCGLKHEDLVRLSNLPDDVLDLKSLPRILQQVHSDKEAARHFSPSSSSYSSSSAYQPSTNFSSRDRDQLSNIPVQYPLPSTATSSETLLDRWGNPMTFSSVQSEPSSSSSQSRHLVEYYDRPDPDYGKTGPVPFCSPAEPATRALDPPRSHPGQADHRTTRGAPPPHKEHRSSHWDSPLDPTAPSSWSNRISDSAPSRKEAQDFHGVSPQVYPYSCSLCDITVLSERVWTQHVTGTMHADGQLVLLQQYPNWDCRLEGTSSQFENQPDRWNNTESSVPPACRPRQEQASNRSHQKTSEKGKVVCAKFPAHSVDEAFFRKLVEPFGKLVKIIMFPTLAFLELGSIDQASDLVTYYSQNPCVVNGEVIQFNISNAFKFLQSSQVVSFSPPPGDLDGRSDLLSIVKRFGSPDYTLFLPSKAFVEMKTTADAQMLVDYYSTNALWINKNRITVAFSTEYRTLMRVHSAKTYEEELKAIQKSRESRNRSRDASRRGKRSRSRSRNRSTERTESRQKTRTRSKERRDRDQRSRTRRRSRDVCSRERSTRSRDEPSSSSTPKKQEEKKPGKTQAGDKEAAAGDPVKDEDRSSAAESEIEGMEVIAEDGEKRKDDVEQAADEATERKEENEEKTTGDQKEEVMEQAEEEAEESEACSGVQEEPGFPLNLENCITLDEVESDDEDKGAERRSESPSEISRVIFFSSMPVRFSDQELLKLMKGFGTVVRYLLIRGRRQGFVEMSTASEAVKVTRHLDSKYINIAGCRLYGTLSKKYIRLTNGWDVKPDKKRRTRGSDRTGSPDGKESPRRSRGKRESSRRNKSEKSPEKDSSCKKEDELTKKSESGKDSDQKPTKSPENRKRTSDNSETLKARKKPAEKEIEDQKASESEKADEKCSSSDPHQQVEMQAEPTKPVGAEFVRPVVGYFCSLCQMIFCDEDEAKLKHCSTLDHYRKYKEKTGQDPWTI